MAEVFLAFFRLGCLSFGGPVTHLGMFRAEFVQRRRWLSEEAFGQCIALTQLLPGPASSQTGMLIGYLRAGPLGSLTAWIAFTLPSAVLMTIFALNAVIWNSQLGWVRGVLAVAAAIVAQAVLSMRRSLARTPLQLAMLFATFAAVLVSPLPQTGPIAIGVCALTGMLFAHGSVSIEHPLDMRISRRAGVVAAIAFALTLGALAIAARTGNLALRLAWSMFRTGILVFGGGHVVLPMLQTQAVREGIATPHQLIGGYAAAQLMPGPLFTISSYVGAASFNGALGILGAFIATLAIFAPSFFLLAAVAPFYAQLCRNERFAAALAAANASVVGLLAAAFVTPVWMNAIHGWREGVIAAAAFAAMTVWKRPAWNAVLAGALAGAAFLR